MALTDKQQRFIEEYPVDCNATQAAIRAGYAEKTANREGTRLLSNAVIQEAIAEAMRERSRRTLVAADEVIKGLLAEAKKTGEGSSHSARVQAWTQLGKHLGLFVDRTRHEGSVALEVVEEIVDADPTPAPKGRPAARRPGRVPKE